MTPKDWIDLLQRLFAWLRERRNPVRQQAARVLETFEAHGVARTEINALLPETLQLSAYQWSSADQLKLALRQFIPATQLISLFKSPWAKGEFLTTIATP